MIEVEELQKNFKKIIREPGMYGSIKSFFHPEYVTYEAVKSLNFDVPKGEILGLIGSNGAGKSTTIKMLTGILTPTSGKCLINGKEPSTDRNDFVKDIGVVFGQRTQLWWDLPLQETFVILREIYDIPNTIFFKRMKFLDEVLDLSSFINDPVRTLSLGQRMRADIAASLLHNPKVLFLDEPTIGLDVAVKDNIRKAIKRINEEEQTTVILTTHDVSDIENLCNRIIMIDNGRSIFDGSLNKLKSKFGNLHTIEFTLKEEQDFSLLNIYNKKDFIIENSPSKLIIKFDNNKYQAPEIIENILPKVSVSDISMKESSLEDIIKMFYRKEINFE